MNLPVPTPSSALTEVVVPCTREGMVSAADQETLVSWLRGQGFAGVVLQGPLSHGSRFDLLEREEICGSWRSGLPPASQILMALPPAWRTQLSAEARADSTNTPALLNQAATVREWGADGIVTSEGAATSLLKQELREMDLTVLGLPIVPDPFSPTPLELLVTTGPASPPLTLFRAGAFLGRLARQSGDEKLIRNMREWFAGFPAEAAPQFGLWILEWGGIISGRGAFDPYSPPLPENAKSGLLQCLGDAGFSDGFLKES